MVENLIEKYVTNSKKNFWDGSPFNRLLKLGIDERGKLGEELVCQLLRAYTILTCIWDGDKNTSRKDGTIWDIFIQIFESEIKTAMRGSSVATWQHEKIVQEQVWKKIVFVDFDYRGIWFTVQNYSDIPFEKQTHKILGKKSTKCKGGWKFDLTIKHILTLEKLGYSFYYDVNNPDLQGFKKFFELHFSN